MTWMYLRDENDQQATIQNEYEARARAMMSDPENAAIFMRGSEDGAVTGFLMTPEAVKAFPHILLNVSGWQPLPGCPGGKWSHLCGDRHAFIRYDLEEE